MYYVPSISSWLHVHTTEEYSIELGLFWLRCLSEFLTLDSRGVAHGDRHSGSRRAHLRQRSRRNGLPKLQHEYNDQYKLKARHGILHARLSPFYTHKVRGSGTVGRVVASKTRDTWFEYRHRLFLITVTFIEKMEITWKETGNAQFDKKQGKCS